MTFAYRYIGPLAIKLDTADAPPGRRVSTSEALGGCLDDAPGLLTEGMTFVIDLEGVLVVAPRRSEHVACAGGADVLAAGELWLRRSGARVSVSSCSNQSTGYCPDVDSWGVVATALRQVGVVPPTGFSHEIHFRRCPVCTETNLVKEGWFFCVFCEQALPAQWNFGSRYSLRS